MSGILASFCLRFVCLGRTDLENLPLEQSLQTLHGHDMILISLRNLTQQSVEMFEIPL